MADLKRDHLEDQPDEVVEVEKCEDCPFLRDSDLVQFDTCGYAPGRSFKYDLYKRTHEMRDHDGILNFPEWCPLTSVLVKRKG